MMTTLIFLSETCRFDNNPNTETSSNLSAALTIDERMVLTYESRH